MNGRFLVIPTGLLLPMVLSPFVQAQSLDPKSALELITTAADQLCYVINDRGSSSSNEVNGTVDVHLNVLAAKLVDANIRGAGKITNEEFQSVLREQLATSIRDSAACKLTVFKELVTKFDWTRPARPIAEDAPTDAPAIYPETDATRVRGFQFTSSPSEIKPGLRKWALLPSDVWEQTYPDGTKEFNYVVKRIHLAECDGTVVSKKGEPEFQGFFPDKNCDQKTFMFRHLSQGNTWYPYVPIDTMK